MNNNIKNVIDAMFGANSKLAKGYNRYTIEQTWRNTFGDMISQYTSRVEFNNGTLVVYLTSAPLKNEILNSKTSVIEKMNQNLQYHKVKNLIIR